MPALSLLYRPAAITSHLQSVQNAPLTDDIKRRRPRSFGRMLETQELSAQDHIDQ